MYDNWEVDAERHAEEAKDGWEALQAQLQEDEQWAQYLHSQFHGQEY